MMMELDPDPELPDVPEPAAVSDSTSSSNWLPTPDAIIVDD